eukprot:263556_1
MGKCASNLPAEYHTIPPHTTNKSQSKQNTSLILNKETQTNIIYNKGKSKQCNSDGGESIHDITKCISNTEMKHSSSDQYDIETQTNIICNKDKLKQCNSDSNESINDIYVTKDINNTDNSSNDEHIPFVSVTRDYKTHIIIFGFAKSALNTNILPTDIANIIHSFLVIVFDFDIITDYDTKDALELNNDIY